MIRITSLTMNYMYSGKNFRQAGNDTQEVKVDEFLDFISPTDLATVHFFNKASVVVT